jgi:hypothetical protein
VIFETSGWLRRGGPSSRASAAVGVSAARTAGAMPTCEPKTPCWLSDLAGDAVNKVPRKM